MVFRDISLPSSRLAGFLGYSCLCCPNILSLTGFLWGEQSRPVLEDKEDPGCSIEL